MSKTITGNIVGIPNPVSDWEQTNPNMADYIKNKPKNIVNTVNDKSGDIVLSAIDVGADVAGSAEYALSEAKSYVNQAISKIPTPDVSGQISDHNTSTSAHNDVRLLIKDISDRLNAFFDSDDQTLDELSEIVEYIKNNKSLIDNITTSKVNVDDIIDNLVTNVSTKPLSAAQGVILKSLVDALNNSKLDISALQNAINDALAQAKDSGDFDGTDGVGVTNTEITDGGELIIYYSNDTSKNLGNVVGANGEKGDQGPQGEQGIQGIQGVQGETGNGIASTYVNSLGELVIVYTNGDEINLGKVVGDKGDQGLHGERGEKGDKGDPGADGYTPVKGTDYWTASDKAEIVSDVIASLPVYDGSVV